MTSILTTPHIAEQLPPYTSDPETSSVSSRAPSYISAAPAYDHIVSPSAAFSSGGNDALHAQGDGAPLPSSANANGTTAPMSTVGSGLTTTHSSEASVQQPVTSASSHKSCSAQSSQHRQEARFARTGGLPNHPFAEGFIPRLPGSIPNSTCFDSNILSSRRLRNTKTYLKGSSCADDRPSTRNSHATRQYHAVAKRRAREGRDGAEQVSNNSKSNSRGGVNLSAHGSDGSSGLSRPEDATAGIVKGTLGVKLGAGPSSSSSPSIEGTGAVTAALEARTDDSIADPLEDPYLVGEDAAKRAKETRLYRETCLREAEAMSGESKAWDFFMSQTADWEDRSRSWKRFRADVDKRHANKILGRRIMLGMGF